MTTVTIAEKAADLPVKSSGLPGDLKVTQLRLVRSEWLKFRSLRSTYATLLATILGMVGFGILFAAVTASRWSVMDARERARFDPTAVSLRGYFLAQLVVGVLGVLIVSGEYGTGMIRATLSAAPKRLPVLWAKVIVFAVVTFVVTTLSSLVAFLAGQAILSSQHIETTLAAPNVLRAVIGTGLYLTVVGLLGVALGWIIRHTAGAIATVFGLLLVLPALGDALPTSWGDHINPYLPSNAGQQLVSVQHEIGMLSPWSGFAVFYLYAVVGIAVAAVLLKRRDA
jgi:ABC-type transport system involved in multi-copper enzyme maturation permease subunit